MSRVRPARLGQHFLFDPAILGRIALATGPVAGGAVIEVGPGHGGLTRALLDAGADPVIAIEIDAALVDNLRNWPEVSVGRLVVVHTDALSINWHDFADRQGISSARVIANLPYQIAGRLIVEWLGVQGWRRQIAVMVQKEVAERLCARPGSSEYGRLSVLAQAVAVPRIVLTLRPGAFRPPPKVDSSLVVMEPLGSDECCRNWQALLAVTGVVFGQRRKMLRVSLRSFLSGADPVPVLEALGICPTRRPQTLTGAEFLALSEALESVVRPTGN